jgi:hypothetical protein
MESSFLGRKFQALSLKQQDWLTEFLSRHPQPLSGFTFASFASWLPIFQYEWTKLESGAMLISCLVGPEQRRHLIQPIGSLSPAERSQLADAARGLPYPLKIVGVCEEFLQAEPGWGDHFTLVEDTSASNYIYLSDMLSRLPGRKYARKRNLLSQAQALYHWTTEPITESVTEACREVLQRIQDEEKPELDTNLQQELAALERTLYLWQALRQQGILLRVEEQPVAFSIFEPIAHDTVAVHFERAVRSYKGLYQVINWESARIIAAQEFTFINREEDLGSPGLREAKRSYVPVKMVPAYELTLRSIHLQGPGLPGNDGHQVWIQTTPCQE